ncbi:transcriptional regulator, AlpA family [Pseudomonas lundensis]|jgi:prophage regulatory protein|uniref:AlpA family phage regulatory protein n=1 Tax=Pseudomonas lundensis TaxID=86185 RepID=UPI00088B203E|nr:AlpA family transcriptional regulator [Pseudomonas lundensis]SDQ47171.1 transcriptional regulator, AlpA family [Pseudomonas lundensis]
MEQSNDPNAIVILRRAQVEKRTGLTKSGIYFLINNGSFPRPVPLGIRAVGWVEAEVSAWLSHKCEKRLTQAVR